MRTLFYRNDWSANASRQVDDKYGGVGYYRIVQPQRHFRGESIILGAGLGVKGETGEQKWTRIFKEYDVFWTSYFSDPRLASEMYYHRDKFKKKVVVDLDDNYLDIAETHHLYDRFKPSKKDRAFTSTILSFADVITVSTEPLRQRIDEHMRRVYDLKKTIIVVPNMNELSDWQFKPVKKDKDKIIIGYAGSNSHYDDLKMFLPHLSKIMTKYRQVHFDIMGSVSESDAIKLFANFSDDAQKRCDLLPPTATFGEYPEHLASMRWNLGVAPLVDSAFTRCKSPIKFFEYSMYKIPVVASRVYPYYVPSMGRDVITHGKTGLLVKPNEWYDALDDLIRHPEKGKLLGENAYNHIKENFQYDEAFRDRIDEVVKALQ